MGSVLAAAGPSRRRSPPLPRASLGLSASASLSTLISVLVTEIQRIHVRECNRPFPSRGRAVAGMRGGQCKASPRPTNKNSPRDPISRAVPCPGQLGPSASHRERQSRRQPRQKRPCYASRRAGRLQVRPLHRRKDDRRSPACAASSADPASMAVRRRAGSR
jgi:hypothetical protein